MNPEETHVYGWATTVPYHILPGPGEISNADRRGDMRVAYHCAIRTPKPTHYTFLYYFLIYFCQAFTTDFRVHWGQHLLRPEFVESTYFLYKVK